MLLIFERGGRAPVQADVGLLPTAHPDLLTVIVSGEPIGSLRRIEGKGWMALGAFAIDPKITPDYADTRCERASAYTNGKAPKDGRRLPDPDLYNLYWEDRDVAMAALVTAWVDALARAIRRLKARRERREILFRRHDGH